VVDEDTKLVTESDGNIEFRIDGGGPGRAQFVASDGTLYISRRYDILRSTDWGDTWQVDCSVPSAGWKPVAAKMRLGARLLRYYVAALQVLPDGSRVAVAREGIYRAGPGETHMTQTFEVTRGSRPLNLAVDGMRVLFGEYGRLQSAQVRIYVSEDGGKSFDVAFCFPKGEVKHIHNIVFDRYRDHYWVLAGDQDHQAGIGALSKDLRTLEWLNRRDQLHRAVGMIVEPECLLYGTDSDHERNFIVRMDKQSGEVCKLLEVEGSSLYAATFGPLRLISTCVEPNPACPSRECSLYASRDGVRWKRVVSYHKDKFHFPSFQLGAIVLPYAFHAQPRGIYSGQAVQGEDDRLSLITFP
jgi:hypothetical protein